MAIDDIKKKASSAYEKSVDLGGKVYDASAPYRATGKSIIAAARGNLFEFPVFISSSVQLDYATATSSLLEQVYASYLQAALSLNPIVDGSLVKNRTPFAQFQSDTNRYVEYTDMDYAHDAVHNEYVLEDGNVLEFDMISIEDVDGKVILEYYDKRPLSEFDHYFQEADDGFEETKRHNEAEEEHKRKQLRHQIVKDRHEQKQHEKERKEDMDRELNFKYDVPELLDETKIKKLNTMKPLMMNVSFIVQADDNSLSRPVNYVVAVKTYNRIIDADILPEVAEYPLKEMNKIARKAKWRAGELKFFRDIIFKVKQKKQTAIDSRDPKRKWFRRLYELAHMKGDAPAKAAIKGKNIAWSVVKSQLENEFDFGIIPNSTLVISNEDVINVKAKTGIDLLNGGTATKFCKELFLIGMVVIDTNAESIKILLPDNHDDYEVHSLASVNKQLAELSTAGSKTRDIFKLLG